LLQATRLVPIVFTESDRILKGEKPANLPV
jgi:hypothetical protein